MANKTVLTPDELAYLAKLARRSDSPNAEEPGFTLDGGLDANNLLLQLGARANLTLEAELEDYHLSFPLQLSEDEFHSIRLQLAPPTIYERGPVLRAWRLALDEPLPLLAEDGGETALTVHELSPKGLLVDTGGQRKAPKHFHLRLALPGERSLLIEARRIRAVERGMTAYEVDFPQEEDAECIRNYLYQEHQRLYPELQPELPNEVR